MKLWKKIKSLSKWKIALAVIITLAIAFTFLPQSKYKVGDCVGGGMFVFQITKVINSEKIYRINAYLIKVNPKNKMGNGIIDFKKLDESELPWVNCATGEVIKR